MHVCRVCEVEKPVTAFRVHKRGYRIGKCRECENAYQREWCKRDPEEYRRRKRESMSRRRAMDPETSRQRAMAHHFKNHERSKAALRGYYAKRFFWGRAMKLRGHGRASHRELARLWKEQRGRCALTGQRLDRKAQLDHILPKARGGDDSLANLRWTCGAVNIAKRHMTDAEFFALCGSVMRWIGERIAQVERVREE